MNVALRPPYNWRYLPYSGLFTHFGQVTVILLSLGKTFPKKRYKASPFDKNSGTTAQDLA